MPRRCRKGALRLRGINSRDHRDVTRSGRKTVKLGDRVVVFFRPRTEEDTDTSPQHRLSRWSINLPRVVVYHFSDRKSLPITTLVEAAVEEESLKVLHTFYDL